MHRPHRQRLQRRISRFSPINAQLDGGSLNLANRTLTDASGQTVEATKPLFWPNAMPVVAGSADDRRSGNIGIGAGSEAGFGVNADTLGRLVRIASDSSNFSFDHGNAILAEVGRASLLIEGGQQMPVVWGRWLNLPDKQFVLIDDDRQRIGASNFHYAAAPMVTPDSNCRRQCWAIWSGGYKLLAGTAPTSEQPGERGTLLALGILVDFSHRQIADTSCSSASAAATTASRQVRVAFGDAQFKIAAGGSAAAAAAAVRSAAKPAVHSSGRRQKASLPAMRWATTARNTSMAQQCWR